MIFQGRSPWRRNARTTRCMQMWRSQTKKHMGCSRVLLDHRIGWWENFNRKALYLMVKNPWVSCKFSLKPIQWLEESLRNLMFGNCFMFLLTCQNPEQFCSWHSCILRNFQEDQQKKLGRTSSTRFISKKYCVWGKKRNDCGCNFKFVAFLNAAC